MRRLYGTLLLLSVSWMLLVGCEEQGSESTPQTNSAEVSAALRAIDQSLTAGHTDAAVTIARKLVLIAPEDPILQETLGRALLARATSVGGPTARASQEEALVAYETAARLTPHHAGLAHAAGVVADLLGRTPTAIEWYRRAGEIDPLSPSYPLYEGLALSRSALPMQAIAPLARSVAIAPSNAMCLAALAEAYARTGQMDLAISTASRAREIAPNDGVVRIMEARIVRLAQQPDRAVRLLFAMDAIARTDPAAAMELGASLTMLGRHAEAADALERSAVEHPTDGALLEATALACAHSGMIDRAIFWVNRVRAGGFTPAQEEILRHKVVEIGRGSTSPTPSPSPQPSTTVNP
ncbi:MAG: tetratricopeptide repeat protein [Planctomycetota bacterium]|nr:tetratricopeptide repeat protein [Planctomycetota bacterium]